MKQLWTAIALLLASTVAFGQASPGGNAYIPGVGSLTPTLTSVNTTSATAPYQFNGTEIARFVSDPGGGYSIFFGEGAGATTTNANIAAMTKGFFTCSGYNSCGGAGTGMTGTIVENTAFGWSAGSFWTTATFNVALGVGTQRNDATAVNCVAVGVDSMGQEGTVTGCVNSVGVGIGSLKWGTAGPSTTVGVGTSAFGGNTGGTSVFTSDTCIGDSCFDSSSAGTLSFDTGIGANVGKNQTSGNYNFYGGYSAGSAETTGAHNVILAPNNNTSVCATGQNNTLVGYEEDCPASGTGNLMRFGSAGTHVLNNYANVRTSGNISSCGTSPAITAASSDMAGTITTGSGATACILTFGTATGTAPTCLVTARSGTAPVYATSDNGTTATLALSTAAASSTYDYWCPVH